MGAENQAKHRQEGRSLRRKAATKKSADRVLIICEGSKTEPQYLDEIRKQQRLPTAYVHLIGAPRGNDPLNLVKSAEGIFLNGDPHRKIGKRAFDQIVVVFDRDAHTNYHQALSHANQLNLAMMNDIKTKVPFEICASVPCFELWLLLHFQDIPALLDRSMVYRLLKNHIKEYEKGDQGMWLRTMPKLEIAQHRASQLSNQTTRNNDFGPYTDMHTLVCKLLHLTKQPSMT